MHYSLVSQKKSIPVQRHCSPCTGMIPPGPDLRRQTTLTKRSYTSTSKMLEKKSFIGFCGEPLKNAFQIPCEIANLIGCHRVAVKLRLKGKSLPGCPGSDRFKQFLKYKWNLKLGATFQIFI